MSANPDSAPTTTRLPEGLSLAEFWPHYLGEHRSRPNRALHFVGTGLGAVLLVYAIVTRTYWLIALTPVTGYGFAWFGHFFIERNRPATFQYPGKSFVCDWIMLFKIATFQLHKDLAKLPPVGEPSAPQPHAQPVEG